MKFVVSSSDLLRGLNSVSRVIASKSTNAILENFLFDLKGNTLSVTASDGETTLRTALEIEQVLEEGAIAVSAKTLTDSLKEFPDQPLTFTANASSLEIRWASGQSRIPYYPAEDYPDLPTVGENMETIVMPAEILLNGINETIYATAEEELRPVMNGIFFDIDLDSTSMVASDAHKLICYTVKDVNAQQKCSFILHKKPASILKAVLVKAEDEVTIKFNNKNACFSFASTVLFCRLIEGNYPAYKSIIPRNCPLKMVIGRIDFLNAVRRVAVCASQATSHVVLKIAAGEMMISAEDLSFATSAYEHVSCQYTGDPIEIGFKAPFLAEILSNLPYENVCMEMTDRHRAALILSADEKNPDEDICALLMPVMVGN